MRAELLVPLTETRDPEEGRVCGGEIQEQILEFNFILGHPKNYMWSWALEEKSGHTVGSRRQTEGI